MISLRLIGLFAMLSIIGCNQDDSNLSNQRSTNPIDIGVNRATMAFCGNTINFNTTRNVLDALNAEVTTNEGGENSFNLSCRRDQARGVLIIENGVDDEVIFIDEIIISFNNENKVNELIVISSETSQYRQVLSSLRHLFGTPKNGLIGLEWEGENSFIVVRELYNRAAIILDNSQGI